MKKTLLLSNFTTYSIFILMMGLLLSCNHEKQQGEIEKAKEQIDSLTQLTKKQVDHIKDMESFITSISQTMDSIDIQEKELIVDGDVEKKKTITKESIINNLQKYKETIERQKEQIANLEKQLTANKDEMSAKMLQIVNYYKQQLDEKDRTIASLKKSISENKTNIAKLQKSVNSLLATTKKQQGTIKEQEDVMTRQSDMINTCYVRIGTKKELKAAGLISSGFLKKTKLNESSMLTNHFTAVDMRNCNDILIKSSNPKILTQMPVSSYNIIKNDNGTCYLHITDPNSFWSISRFLVIQL